MVIRICSYNVLCSHLSAPSHFRSCKPENLEPKQRLKKVLEKLELEVKQEAICCLQEVSMTWSGDLHKFFLDRDYYFIPSLYGSAFSNYMGIGIAFPRSRYTLIHTETHCVAESKQLSRSPKTFATINYLPRLLWMGALSCVRHAWSFLTRAMQLVGLIRKPHPFVTDQDKCCWEVSLNRRNTLIFLRLQEAQATGAAPRSFCVATYHMPCVFWDERVMVHAVTHVIHCRDSACMLHIIHCDLQVHNPLCHPCHDRKHLSLVRGAAMQPALPSYGLRCQGQLYSPRCWRLVYFSNMYTFQTYVRCSWAIPRLHFERMSGHSSNILSAVGSCDHPACALPQRLWRIATGGSCAERNPPPPPSSLSRPRSAPDNKKDTGARSK